MGTFSKLLSKVISKLGVRLERTGKEDGRKNKGRVRAAVTKVQERWLCCKEKLI